MTNRLSIGDYVWGKVEGHPWWPGVIRSQRKKHFEILFFGDFSKAFLEPKDLKPLTDENAEAFSRNPEVKLCLDQALLVQSGQTTIQKEI